MKITDKHFKSFKRYAEEWAEFLGVSDWEIMFKHEDITENEKDEDSSAYTEVDVSAKRAVIALNTEIDIVEGSVDDELRNSAFHEVMEVILLEFQMICELRCERDAERVKHGIINRLWTAFGSQYE